MSAHQPHEATGDAGHGACSLPADWRDQLASMLGTRPRRIGLWAEMAIFGARRCLDATGSGELPSGAVVRIASDCGPVEALAQVGSAFEAGLLPMPFDFLQSQPSQMLAAFSLHMKWRGDASFVALDGWGPLQARMRLEAAILRERAELAGQPWAGMLLGRVDLGQEPASQWLWIDR
jgi:hypothetical protein